MAYRRGILPPSTKCVPVLIVFLLLLTTGFLSSEQSTSEAELLEAVRKAQAGDEEAFRILYQWYYPQIYKHLLRLLDNIEDTADLTAEAFLKAWCALADLRDESRFRSWLFSIATHKALDLLRQRRSRYQSWEELNKDHIDEQASALEVCVEKRELIRLALMRVTPKPRACLLLQLEGFNHAEIAELVGLGTKSVGTYVSMAREQLRRAYHQLECLRNRQD